MISLRDVVTGFGNLDPLAEVWRRSLRGGGGGSAVITGVPPLRYIGNGRPLTDYLISGNTVQDGTPTPESPAPVVGCGTDTADGFKLHLTVNGVEYPIYLGQVSTVRRIKKWLFDGTESWSKYNNKLIISRPSDMPSSTTAILSSHFRLLNAAGQAGTFYVGNSNVNFNFDGKNDVDAWKTFLSGQYAAGTPVTVWYVLATPETAVVNEPLMKIGDYTDTVSFAQAGVTIPTVSGENVLDVPTEVKPSQITIKGGIRSV